MLHRTRAEQVVPVFESFLQRYPDVKVLAATTQADVLALLEPLGLNWRFNSFIPMARMVVEDFDGRVPKTVDDLLHLPGVGSYTAEAVLSFAFGLPVAVVDTNTIRVAGQYLRNADWRGDARKGKDVRNAVRSLIDTSRAAPSNYALLDFASEICTSHHPQCDRCPVQNACQHFSDATLPHSKRSTGKVKSGDNRDNHG